MISQAEQEAAALLVRSALSLAEVMQPMAEGRVLPDNMHEAGSIYFETIASLGCILLVPWPELLKVILRDGSAAKEKERERFEALLLADVGLGDSPAPAPPSVPESRDGNTGDDVDRGWFEMLLGEAEIRLDPRCSYIDEQDATPPKWFLMEHKGGVYSWRVRTPCMDEEHARQLFDEYTTKRKTGGFRIMAPDGEIVAEKWLGWRGKRTDPPPVCLPISAAQGGG
jgi:hypothetical protein